jgi:hypothetical protein
VRRCCLCKIEKELDAFLTITERQKRNGRIYEYVKPSYDCRECRNEAKRDGRRRKAEANGRTFVARGNQVEYEARCAAL